MIHRRLCLSCLSHLYICNLLFRVGSYYVSTPGTLETYYVSTHGTLETYYVSTHWTLETYYVSTLGTLGTYFETRFASSLLRGPSSALLASALLSLLGTYV